MRLWSIHPEYLDVLGLVAAWKEGIQGINALKRSMKEPENKSIMFLNHPQLKRFKSTGNPIKYLNWYLSEVFYESLKRGYKFNKNLIEIPTEKEDAIIPVTTGQIKYEVKLLMYKYEYERKRKPTGNKLFNIAELYLHPLFYKVCGEIEEWEKVRQEIIEYNVNLRDFKIKDK